MVVRNGRNRALCAAVVLGLVAVSGCSGSADSDVDDVRMVVQSFVDGFGDRGVDVLALTTVTDASVVRCDSDVWSPVVGAVDVVGDDASVALTTGDDVTEVAVHRVGGQWRVDVAAPWVQDVTVVPAGAPVEVTIGMGGDCTLTEVGEETQVFVLPVPTSVAFDDPTGLVDTLPVEAQALVSDDGLPRAEGFVLDYRGAALSAASRDALATAVTQNLTECAPDAVPTSECPGDVGSFGAVDAEAAGDGVAFELSAEALNVEDGHWVVDPLVVRVPVMGSLAEDEWSYVDVSYRAVLSGNADVEVAVELDPEAAGTGS